MEKFLLSGERLHWSHTTPWTQNRTTRFLGILYSAGTLAIFITALVHLFLPDSRTFAIMLFMICFAMATMASIILYAVGLFSPITFAITDRRIIWFRTHIGQHQLRSYLLDDIANAEIPVAFPLLSYGVRVEISYLKVPITVLTGDGEREQVLRILTEAVAAYRRDFPFNGSTQYTSFSGAANLYSAPEALQTALNQSSTSIKVVSSEPLFNYVWVNAFAPWIAMAFLAVFLLVTYAVLPAESPRSPAAPAALNQTALIPTAAPSAVGASIFSTPLPFMLLLIGAVFGFMTISTGVFGRVSSAVTSTSLLYSISLFGNSGSCRGARTVSHRDVIRYGVIAIPSSATDGHAAKGHFLIYGSTVAMPQVLSTYNYTICSAALNPNTENDPAVVL